MPFINYAHRGASEYFPENTLLSFYAGIAMGAGGIETDVRRSADGKLVLFHDHSLLRVTGVDGTVEEHTLAELKELWVKKGRFCDRILPFREFLEKFSHFDLTFAIELKGAGVEDGVAALLREFDLSQKAVVTSFSLDFLQKFHSFAPEFERGLLTPDVDENLLETLKREGILELCPKAEILTPEKVKNWKDRGFRVRAWGVSNERLMETAYLAGVDGMTVNFPDRLQTLRTRFEKTEEL